MSQKTKREAQPTRVDGEWESNGMYRWYIGSQKRTKSEAETHFAEVKAYLSQPWPARLAECREWLTEMIAPWWEGPLDESEFWQDQREGSLGFGEKVAGRIKWRRKPIGEIVVAHASTGRGCYRMVDGAPKGGYVHDAIEALVTIDLLETKLTEGNDLDSIVRLSFELGQAIEIVHHQALFAPIVFVGRDLIVERPKALRKGRVENAAEKRKVDLAVAEAALKWARRSFPALVLDKQIDQLKTKAAKHIGKHKRTLNRWLRYK